MITNIILERESLFKLLEKYPDMGIKFYLSMLKNLSKRLRDQK